MLHAQGDFKIFGGHFDKNDLPKMNFWDILILEINPLTVFSVCVCVCVCGGGGGGGGLPNIFVHNSYNF